MIKSGLNSFPRPKSTGAAGAIPAVHTVVLLHFDGTNGSTSFPDATNLHTFTAHGSAALSTTQAKFGTASLSAGYTTTPDAAEFRPTGDFTIEGWLFTTATPSSVKGLFSKRASSAVFVGCQMFVNSSGQIQATATNQAGVWTQTFTGSTFTNSAWHHWAMVRSSGSVACYFDGSNFGTPTSITGALIDDGSAWTVGAGGANGDQVWTDFIDEVRFSNVARYTSNFTPPSAPFVVD